MRQTGRRTFLRLIAGAAVSGSTLDGLLRKLGSQPLRPSTDQTATGLKLGLISDLNGAYGSTHYGSGVQRGVKLLLQQHEKEEAC